VQAVDEEMSTDPIVSVIVPVYNRVDLLQEAVRSVLAQSFSDFELIVVDDGSAADIEGALRLFGDRRIRYIRHDANLGAAAARNTGIAEARGRFCAFLDSDDQWHPQKLARQIAFMSEGLPERPLSCTTYRIFGRYEPEGVIRTSPDELTFRHMLLGCTISPRSTMMAERSFLSAIGWFDANMARLEDWDFLLRATRALPVVILQEPLSVIHLSERQLSYDAVKSACDRIRAKAAGFNLSLVNRITLVATIENELAFAAYRVGRYGRALRHFAYSLLLYPHKELSYFRRVFGAVKFDLTAKWSRAAGRGRESTG
jgi:glycosyltransferase involved in cell wall biosynthesis